MGWGWHYESTGRGRLPLKAKLFWSKKEERESEKHSQNTRAQYVAKGGRASAILIVFLFPRLER